MHFNCILIFYWKWNGVFLVSIWQRFTLVLYAYPVPEDQSLWFLCLGASPCPCPWWVSPWPFSWGQSLSLVAQSLLTSLLKMTWTFLVSFYFRGKNRESSSMLLILILTFLTSIPTVSIYSFKAKSRLENTQRNFRCIECSRINGIISTDAIQWILTWAVIKYS